jgi:hypothetical protein
MASCCLEATHLLCADTITTTDSVIMHVLNVELNKSCHLSQRVIRAALESIFTPLLAWMVRTMETQNQNSHVSHMCREALSNTASMSTMCVLLLVCAAGDKFVDVRRMIALTLRL